MKYGDLTLGQIEALVNKVGGIDRVKRVLSGRTEVVLVSHWRTIIGLGFKTWQTVQLGTFQSEDDLRKALDDAGSDGGYSDGSGKSSRDVTNIELSQPRIVNLVIAEVDDLGASGNTMKEIYSAANKLGLDYCPDETAAQVLLQCKVDLRGMPECHELQFAMNSNRRGGHGFRIRQHEANPYLTRFSNSLYYTRSGSEKFVFTIPG